MFYLFFFCFLLLVLIFCIKNRDVGGFERIGFDFFLIIMVVIVLYK